jgi:transposase InsO family protein/transposase-like protein
MTLKEGGMPSRYPPEFRRRVLELVAAGRPIAEIAANLGVSAQTIYTWRNQALIDLGERAGVTSSDLAELVAARRRIAELETELAATKRANELLKQVVLPKGRFEAIAQMAGEGHPAQVACRVLAVSESGFYAWRTRSPSVRVIRHAWLTDVITQVHLESNGTYGALRVRAELVMGRGITVGQGAVAMLMRRAGLQGLPGARKRRSRHETPTASDLVERSFARAEPNQLWVTDITEHPTREGKVYCAVVLDTFSRRIVGWSIDASPTASLVTNALGMAIENRRPSPGALIHSDHGTQFTSWAFTRRALESGLVASMGSIGDCFDNAVVESFWGRMQVELLNRRRWKTRVELANAIFEYLEIFHNRKRRHSALGMQTPIEFEKMHTHPSEVA